MATTTNFGWTTPDDTDLVKDGAAAIRTLGSAIDTSLVDLKGGTTGQVLAKASGTDMDFTWASDATGIQATIFDAKGDLIAASAADTAARLAVGANGTVLTADSSEATGLKWATPSVDKTWSLVNAGGTALTGASTITVSGITGADQLFVRIETASSANANAYVTLYLNGDTTSANYSIQGFYVVGATTWAATSTVGTSGLFRFARMSNNAGSAVDGYCYITGCNTSGLKMMNGAGGASVSSGNSQINYSIGGSYEGGSAITEVNIVSSTGNFDNGTVYVYKA